MNAVCVICSDLLEQSNEIVHTRCGHVFHRRCLLQWFERSKTCPQCREKTSQSSTDRLYFTFSDHEVPESNSVPLQERLDSLKFQILLKDKNISHYTSQNHTLMKQNTGLKREIRKTESELNRQQSAIHALKEQIAYFKEQGSERDRLKKEIIHLKMQLDELRPVQVLLHAPPEDVEEMVAQTDDRDTLLSYIAVMKHEILTIVRKCEKLRVAARTLEEDNTKLLAEKKAFQKEHLKRLELEDELMISDSKNMALEKRIRELEELYGIKESSTLEETNQEPTVSAQNTTKKTVRKERIQSGGTAVSNKRITYVLGKKTERVKGQLPTARWDSNKIINADESNTSILSDDSPTVPKRSKSSSLQHSSSLSLIIRDESENDSPVKLKKKRNAAVRKENQRIKKEQHNGSIILIT